MSLSSQAASTAERLALVKAKMWKPGRTLRCRFLEGDAAIQQAVQKYAAQWTEHANIRFDFGDDPRAEIRIAFSPGSAWSACGTDSLLTLRVCALHGCEPGSDLRDAWHRALAPRDFESALAIYSWLQRLQEDAAQ